jgi:Tfp pilus assembly protein FimT
LLKQFQHGGYTLIEACASLFILGILITLAFPMLKHFIIRTDDQLMQSHLLHALQLARQEAHAQSVPMVVCQSEDHIHCKSKAKNSLIVFLNEREDGIVQGKEQILAVIQTLSQHCTLYWRTFHRYRDYLLFSATAVTHTDNGSFWYCHDSANPAWAVILNKSGRPRVVYPDKNNEIKDGQGNPLLCS